MAAQNAAQPQLNYTNITDKYLQTNFRNLVSYFAAQNQLLGFQFFEQVFSAATTSFTLAHSLGYLPQDIIVTRITGPGLVTFNYNSFTTTTINMTVTDICRVRFFVGTYWNYQSATANKSTDTATYLATPSSSSSSTSTATSTSTAVYFKPVPRSVLSVGSGTLFSSYAFVCSTFTANSGATYTHKGFVFTVLTSVTNGTSLQCTGTGAPKTSGTLLLASGSGSQTITFSLSKAPLYSRIRIVGAGGGGAGGGTGSGGAGGNASSSSFGGATFITVAGGTGGLSNGQAGTGGAPTVGALAVAAGVSNPIQQTGGDGQANPVSQTTTVNNSGGVGGSSFFGGAGAGTYANNAGGNGKTNSGGGGGGAGGNSSGTQSGSGGGGGAYVDTLIPSPAASYAWVLSDGGTAGTAGTGAQIGGKGGSSGLWYEEFWQ